MYASKKMEKVITELCQRHGFDYTRADGSVLVVKSGGFMDLHITAYASNLVSVAHYFRQGGDAVSDPWMTFFTDVIEGEGWVPCEIEQPPLYVVGYGAGGGYKVATILNLDCQVERFYPKLQKELASFANTWATNIKAQGFLEAGDTRIAA
jgi:Domain of unknown function (DUF6908)